MGAVKNATTHVAAIVLLLEDRFLLVLVQVNPFTFQEGQKDLEGDRGETLTIVPDPVDVSGFKMSM